MTISEQTYKSTLPFSTARVCLVEISQKCPASHFGGSKFHEKEKKYQLDTSKFKKLFLVKKGDKKNKIFF